MAINNAKQHKEQKARVRDFQARNQAHQHRLNKIKRDNIIAIIIAVLAIAAVILVQIWVNQPKEDSEAAESVPPTAETPEIPEETLNTGDVPPVDLAENRTWNGDLLIDNVALELELFGQLAPQAVSSFVHLASNGFFNEVNCHRLTNHPTMKVLQCGDPQGDGTGGPEYAFGPIENAPEDDVYPAGSIAMARVGKDAYSMGSQFFIVLADSTIPSDEAGGYTLFGTVTNGFDALVSEIAGAGIEADALDGKPVAPAVIHQLSVE